MRALIRPLAAVLLLAAAGVGIAAQEPPPVTAGWQDAFVLQAADGAYRLQFGLVAQMDGRFVADDSDAAAIDTFTIRKMRPGLSGRVARFFDFLVVPDFGGGTAVLQDGYVDLRFTTGFRARMGKSKTPIGHELLIADPFVLFPERSLVSSLVPNRDVGIQALGELSDGKIAYAGGLFNGIPDGASSTADVDTNSSKDFAGRIAIQPFRSLPPGMLNGLGFAIGASAGPQEGALPSFRTSVGRRYFSYVATAAASGMRTRVQPAVFYYHGAFGAFSEFARSTQEIVNGGVERAVANTGWEVTGSLVLTGEAASDRGVRPVNSFDPAQGHWGALQLIARYATLHFDDAAVDAGFAAAANPGAAQQVSVGLNWYPSAFIKYYAAYESTTFDEAAVAILPEHSLIVRAQVAF
jgi:phosphate-selective porin OprO/OprP